MAHCGHGADPVALLEVVDRLLPQLGRQLDLEHARLGAHLDGEARVAEHLKHPVVGRMHPRHEGHDATRLGELREVCQQQGGDALTLPGVRDREGELGAIARLGDEARVRDDRLLRAGDRDQAGAALDEPRAAWSACGPDPRKRNQRASGDRPRRKAATPSTSPGPVGRRWTVEPSRRTTSLPSTVAADAVARGGSETVESMSWTRAYVRIGARHIREEPHPIGGAGAGLPVTRSSPQDMRGRGPMSDRPASVNVR